MSTKLTATLKTKGFELGSDLVGVGNIERWKNCPEMMSPKGLMPTAKSVIVCGLHHTDSMVEVGGEKSPHIMETYEYQIFMNHYLDYISFQMARFLEDLGYQAIPIAASNIWRYRPYKNLNSIFAPDMSHIYAAVAAGLAEMGLSGLALTPEFGPRNRFVSIITDAPLTPTPLLPGDTLCDNCKMCVKHCPIDTLSKEIKGTAVLEIEDKRYEFADKNLWRCSWAEHFGLDVDLPAGEKVDENVILKNVDEHGLRGGTIGSCLRYCLPKHLRSWDKNYSSAPIRKKNSTGSDSAILRSTQEEIYADFFTQGMDAIITDDVEGWKAKGVDVKRFLPDAKTLLAIGMRDFEDKENPDVKTFDTIGPASHKIRRVTYFASKKLEALGYNAAPYNGWYPPCPEIEAELENALGEKPLTLTWLATSAPLDKKMDIAETAPIAKPKNLTKHIKALSKRAGADLAGITSAMQIEAIASQIRPIFDGEEILDVKDENPIFHKYNPKITKRIQNVLTCKDYLADAKSVLVLGVRMPKESVKQTAKSPAEAVGPYVFATFEAQRVLELSAMEVIRDLQSLGYKAIGVNDLMATASNIGTPRGETPDIFSSRFAAIAAGLGMITKGGFVVTPEYGTNIRFMTIVTNADLNPDKMTLDDSLISKCKEGCSNCLKSCSATAHLEPVEIKLNDKKISFTPVERKRCDWAKRYAILGDEGFKYIGSTLNITPPSTITEENLSAALVQHDPITKFRPCSAEMCSVDCPLAK